MDYRHGREKGKRASQVRKGSENSGTDNLPRVLGEAETQSTGDRANEIGACGACSAGQADTDSSGGTDVGGITSKLIAEVESLMSYHQSQVEELAVSLRRLKSIHKEDK